jgi:hypothetical protein
MKTIQSRLIECQSGRKLFCTTPNRRTAMTYQTLPRPVPQALIHIFATLSLTQARDAVLDQINALPSHLRRDLGLSAASQSITFVNEEHK